MAEKNHGPVTSPVPSTSKVGNTEARLQRNVAEKQRRDKLNGYISELANIVPMVSMSSKRLDKTSILRLSAAHLRICKSSLSGSRKQKKGLKWCPSFLNEDQVRDILESVDGFLLVTTSSRKVLFTSRSVERYLGHQDIDMIGHSLFTFIHPDDIDAVKEETEKAFLAAKESDKGQHRCSFRCRMKEKGQARAEVVTYQYVHFVGAVNASEEASDENASTSVVNYMFKAFVKVVDISPYNQLSLEEATADEYVTRHSLDGTIIFADHRLATITGHMPHEVVGLSAYAYIHSADTAVTLFAHHLMFSNDKGTGMIVYRLRTRNDKYVYLKSVGCLQFDAATSQVDHFVCVNQHLSDSDGDLQLKYFVDRFIPHIKGSTTSSLFESVKALQSSSTKSTSVADKTSNSLPNKEPGMLMSPYQTNGSDAVKKLEGSKVEDDLQQCGNVQIHNAGLSLKPPINQSQKNSEMQTTGTNTPYKYSAAEAEFFSKTIHRSSSQDVDTIYVSSLDSTLSIYKNSSVKDTAPSRLKLPEKRPESEAGTNGHLTKANSGAITGQLPVSNVPSLRAETDVHEMVHGFDSFPERDRQQLSLGRFSFPVETNEEAACVDQKHLQGARNSLPFPTEFKDENRVVANHSPFIKCESLDNGYLTLSARYPQDSEAVLKNSMWSAEVAKTEENPLMDVSESLSYDGAVGETKAAIQENFSLLNSVMSQADSNSSVDGWNVFNYASYPGDGAKFSDPDFY